MTAGFSPPSPPKSSPSRARARWCGSKAIPPITKRIDADAWAPTPTSLIGSATSRLSAAERAASSAISVPRGGAARPLSQLLPQRRQQRLGAAAIALDDRRELAALRGLHADAVDDDVGDE